MSIDARIRQVKVYPDGSGELLLEDRPDREMFAGPAGQPVLRWAVLPANQFDINPVHWGTGAALVQSLNGCDIWGGDNKIMLGKKEIAQRQGYTQLVWVAAALLGEALQHYKSVGRHPTEWSYDCLWVCCQCGAEIDPSTERYLTRPVVNCLFPERPPLEENGTYCNRCGQAILQEYQSKVSGQ